MKNKIISALLVLILIFCFIPASPSLAAGVTVTATVDSKTDITVPDGTTVNIQVEITNNTGAQIVLEEIYCDTIFEDYKGLDVFIADGASLYFFFDYKVQFGDNLDYGFPVMIRYSGDQPEFSNQLNFNKEVAVNPPIDTRKIFTVTPNRTTVVSGGEVEFNVYVKNTGNVKFVDFTVTLNGNDIKTFDLDPGSVKTFVHKKSYTADKTEKFAYYFNYIGAGGNNTISSGTTVDIDIKVTQPVNAGMSVSASAAQTTVESGKDINVLISAENTGEVDFVDISIKDQYGMLYGGWDRLDKGTSYDTTVTLLPNKTTNYKFTITAKDTGGNTYTFDSNTVSISVTEQEELTEEELRELELAAEAEAQAAAEAEAATAAEAESEKEEKDGIDTLTVILIGAVALLIGAMIPLIVMASKKSKSKKEKNKTEL